MEKLNDPEESEKRKPTGPYMDIETFFEQYSEAALAKINTDDYNGGITVIDWGLMKTPLPVPEKGKKWALRWHDNPSGELLPELAQVPATEPNSGWEEGYPKYE